MEQKRRKQQYIIPPKKGWKKQTYYVVKVAVTHNNPIFMGIYYSGFISNGRPAGYNKLISIDDKYTLDDLYFLEVVREINTEVSIQYMLPKKYLRDEYPEMLI